MSNLVQEWIVKYLREKQPDREGKFREIEESALERGFPIIEPEVGNLLNLLVKLHKPKRILEIGAAIGYSTLWLARDLKGELVTIELNEASAREAQDNFDTLGYDNIKLLTGNALEILPTLEGKFDFIFIDAAKGQYPNFLEESLRLINDGGLIIADDVLFKGMIADDRFYHPRYSTLTRRLREYVDTIMDHPLLDSSIIPLGDGLAISIKKEEE
ncbi:putative O-methyltransferase YrrM [Orenia metallireducens]|uniref:tRNA 5-hydroxyuridine methyltransferase n=1 Tax=Orenia metallireducens TaxID=1413210 RepID=A0A285I8T7_9FIRM|nr:O-methyltransferase [Orenia metallireducens]PRX21685.1 putative O-methyltransferase YrrM [Orenia metallireducens]SNY44378.1 Predicted O-methyltransferase YrrM [Orenia metallireducens]